MMKRLLFILPVIALLHFSACKEKRYFTSVTCGETYLTHIVFEDESFRDFTVVCDVLYAGSDTSSRYKMVFYMPEGWDNSYPFFLDRYVPTDGQAWTAYQGMPVAEAALNRGDMIVVLLAYNEGTAIPDILLAEHFLKEHDTDLPGDSKNILTAAYFDFE
ncbi:MAG: hypothetical protein IJU74_02170 [Bacteroidales bacterium]|nr:hypothetical protein [Bacteroidales bacterium]